MSSADCGAPSVAAERSTSIGPSSTMTTLLALSLPCEMPAACRRATCCHSSSSVSSLTCSGLASSSGSMSGWRVTTSASPFGPRAAVTTSGTRTPACAAIRVASASCSTCSSRPIGSASGRIAVGEQPPAAGEPLRVLCIATEHPHLQRTSCRVVADVLGGADVLLRRRPQVAHLDPERGQRVAHLRGRRHARRRAERQPYDRARAEAERQRGQALPDGQRGAEHDGTERRERDEPRREHTDRADELRADNDDHRGRGGEPQLRVPPARQQMRLRREASRTRRRRPRTMAAPTTHECRDEQIAGEVPPPAQQHVDDDHDREREQAEERRPPERAGPPEHGRQRLCDVVVLSGRRRRDHRRQPDHDRRCDQKDRVDRSPVAASRLGFRQQGDVPGTAGLLVTTQALGCQADAGSAAATRRRSHSRYGRHTIPFTTAAPPEPQPYLGRGNVPRQFTNPRVATWRSLET